MSLAIFLTTDLKMGGGVERWTLNTVKGKPEGQKIILISTDYADRARFSIKTEIPEFDERQTLNLLENKLNFLRKSRVLSFLLDNAMIPLILTLFKNSYRRKLNLSDVDVVYLTKNQYWKLFRGKKIIGSNHTEFGNDGFFSRLKAKLYSSGIIYRDISYFQVFPGRERIEGILGKKAKVSVIPNGTHSRDCDKKTGDSTRFLFVGRLETIKGIQILLDAWRCLKREDCALDVVGAGSLEKEDYSTLNNVNFMGIVTDEELNRIYCRSDVFIYPTLWDSFPNTIIEAMSARCKIVTSRFLEGAFGGDESEAFMTFIEPDVNSILDEINKLAVNKSETRKQGELAYEFFMKNYELTKVNNLFYKFIEKVRNE
ncbi:MAG: glycosyltransferase family 4 protein [Candidatus Thermoplasmatota archaeon]|nr:glycosyltransferase family 4 protein [Candidatus Thermoplasmatota archaeon]